MAIHVTVWIRDLDSLSAMRGLAYGISQRNAVKGCKNAAWAKGGQRSIFHFKDKNEEADFFGRLKNIFNSGCYEVISREED